MQTILGVPITETDTVSVLFGIDRNQIFAFPGATPQSIVDYIDAFDSRTFHAWRTELAWARDSRNDYLQPTRGTLQRIGLEVTLPGSTAEYYKINYEYSKYWPLSRWFILNTRAELGYGDSYGKEATRQVCWNFVPGTPGTPAIPPDPNDPNDPGTPGIPGTPDRNDITACDGPFDDSRTLVGTGLPFYENFYAGGPGSVRGFRDNTLGPRESAFNSSFLQPIGGALKTIGSLEVFFPQLIKSPAARISAFVDVGNVFKNVGAFESSELRVSTGIALMWRAPVGPISISYAFPLRDGENDELERLQFTFRGAF